MDYRIIQPIISRVLQSGHDGEFYVDKNSFALVKEIQKALSIFEPIEDDEARMIWLEIPRGTAEEWKDFEDMHDQYVESDIASYRKALAEEYPYEKRWLFLVTSTYRENTFLKISDRVHEYVIFTNRNLDGKEYAHDMSWFLEPLLHLVKQRVAEITRNPEAYNQHIDEDLPYRQRFGTIKSRFLNKIIPEGKLVVKDQEYCIQVMKELIRREKVYTSVKEGEDVDWEKEGVPAPFDTMSIRRFCKYYRIADTIFWKDSHYERAKEAVSIEDDVEYYQDHGLHNAIGDLNLDSEEDFKSFACDHYGELGLSRTNVRASQYYAGGKWIVTLGVSYSSYVDKALEIAVALYESGAPFVFHDAENLLHILEETGTVRISAFTFHDYLKGDDDEGVISVPYIEDCDKEGELTRQQYDDIVRYAEWEPNDKVAIDKHIPLDDPVYHLIRDEVNESITLSEIRKRIEKKYDCYLGVAQKSRYSGYYHVGALRNRQMSAGIEDIYYPTFNEAMKALILSIKVLEQDTNDNRTE